MSQKDMKVLDFFTLERLGRFTDRPKVPQRIRSALECSWYADITLGELIEQVSEADMLRLPDLGRVCMEVIRQALSEEQLALRRKVRA